MAKVKTAYFCQNCGSQYPQWLGQCKNCGNWNTLVEEIVEKQSKSHTYQIIGEGKQKVTTIVDVEVNAEQRIKTPSEELNRVLGGGIVLGSVTLIGGEPGIGKDSLCVRGGECFTD